jgi:glycosyltransferase involved in cell wall biosynthesis
VNAAGRVGWLRAWRQRLFGGKGGAVAAQSLDSVMAHGRAEDLLQAVASIKHPEQARRALLLLKARSPTPHDDAAAFYRAGALLARRSESWPELLFFGKRELRHQPSNVALLCDIGLALRKMRLVPQIDRLARHLTWRCRTGRLSLGDYITALRALHYRWPLMDVLDRIEREGDRPARVSCIDALIELADLGRASALATQWGVEPVELLPENAAALRHFRSRQQELGVTSSDQAIDAILGRLKGRAAPPPDAQDVARPQRLLIFASSLGVGGGERQLVHLLDHLGRARARYDVTLVVTFRRREFKLPAGLEGIRIVYRDELEAMLAPEAPATLSEAELADIDIILRRPGFEPLLRLAQQVRPDIVYHAVGLPTDALLIGLLTGARTIVRLGGLSFKANYVATDLQAINAHIARRCCAALAPSVVFVTNSRVGRQVWSSSFDAGLERFKVIPNGVEFAPLLSPQDRKKLKVGMFGSADAVVLGYVGRFQNVKRPDLWINVALQLAARDPRLRFLLVGDGPLAPRLQAKVDGTPFRDRFRFTGAVLGGLGDIYQTMDVLLHTSSTESLPNALIEAIGHGAFAVAAPVGGVPEIINAPNSGALVSSDDLQGFVRGLTEVLSRVDELERGRERRAFDMRDRFDLSRMWAEFSQTFGSAENRRTE